MDKKFLLYTGNGEVEGNSDLYYESEYTVIHKYASVTLFIDE